MVYNPIFLHGKHRTGEHWDNNFLPKFTSAPHVKKMGCDHTLLIHWLRWTKIDSWDNYIFLISLQPCYHTPYRLSGYPWCRCTENTLYHYWLSASASLPALLPTSWLLSASLIPLLLKAEGKWCEQVWISSWTLTFAPITNSYHMCVDNYCAAYHVWLWWSLPVGCLSVCVSVLPSWLRVAAHSNAHCL